MSTAGKLNSWTRTLDRFAAVPMFWSSVAFLLMVAGALQEARSGVTWPPGTSLYWWGMLLLYPLFLLELVVHFLIGSRYWRQNLVYSLVPPLRMGARDHSTGRCIWLPRLAWQRTGRELFRRMERAFSGPMILIALMVLPVLAVEHFWAEQVHGNRMLQLLLETATSIIWVAFTIEFIVMISIVEKKFRYCIQHWVDLAVICLPMVAFLRIARLGQLLRLQKLTKLARAYRLRGVAIRMYRGILVLELLQRVVRMNPERRLAQLEETIDERCRELNELRNEAEKLRQLIAAREAERAREAEEECAAGGP